MKNNPNFYKAKQNDKAHSKTQTTLYLANCYAYGRNGYRKNLAKARSYYQEILAAELTQDMRAEINYHCAITYFSEKKDKEAKHHLQLAAKLNHAISQYTLAITLLAEYVQVHARQQPYDYRAMHDMVRLFRKLNQQNPSQLTQYLVQEKFDIAEVIKLFFWDGMHYFNQKDYVLAFDLYSMANRLTVICPQDMSQVKQGLLTARNEIARYLYKNAETDVGIQYQYAYCLEKGIGFKKDLERAKLAYQQAALNGNSDALKRLEKMARRAEISRPASSISDCLSSNPS